MWIMLPDSFLSIVKKDCKADELLVRARRPGDIEKIFPGAKVIVLDTSDYRFRAVVKTEAVERALIGEVRRIVYGNFKNAVEDKPLHDAYLRVWSAMMSFFDHLDEGARAKGKRKATKLRGKGR